MSLVLPDEGLNASHIDKPFLAVCEGMSDATFVARLLRHIGVDTVCVGCPGPKFAGGQGFDALPPYLAGIQAVIKGRVQLKGLIVIFDADQTAKKKFKTIRKALGDAAFPTPASPFKVYNKMMRIAVYIIPGKGKRGTLDHLLFDAAIKKRPVLLTCVDQFSGCTKRVRHWTNNQRAKMRLSAIVAASCQGNPWASANTMWSQRDCPVPIGSSRFAELKAFLSEFTSP